MAVVVEPVVTKEKLRQLLAEQHEGPTLDYKETCALAEQRDLVELVKDVGAMQVDGGYLVIGATSNGQPRGGLTPEQARAFDEATLRAKFSAHTSGAFELRGAVHTIENVLIGIIYVGPNENGCCIFKSDGQYSSTQGSGKPRSVEVFRKGDVFVRHGTASERWQEEDIRRIWVRQRSVLRAQVRAELTEDFAALVANASRTSKGDSLAQGPLGSVDWRLTEEAFLSGVIELSRRNDHVGTRTVLLAMERASSALDLEDDDWNTLLDRLTALAASAVMLELPELFARAVDILFGCYARVARTATTPTQQAKHWLSIATRVVAVGGLVVRRSAWHCLRRLVLLHQGAVTEDYNNWIRHAITMAARSSLLAKKGQLVELAHQYAREHSGVVPDLPSTDERVLDSLCQFDVLWNLVAIAEAKTADERSGDWYPSFGRYLAERVTPALRALLHDTEMRSVLFPASDALLAEALQSMDRASRSEHFTNWWGYSDPDIAAFITTHLRQTQPGS